MKKLVSILLSLVSIITIAFAFVGCGEPQGGEDQSEKIQSKGKAWIHSIDMAYKRGWIDEDDLKSIACRHYEIHEIEENPYAGMFTQQTEIGANAINDIKNLFCDKFNNEDRYESKPIIEPSDVEIDNYYGTYGGNVVVEINYGNDCYFTEKQIGGVEFSNYKRTIYVLHYTEYRSDSAKVTGRMYDVETAYENGWLNENDLKSISCYCYDSYNSSHSTKEENPYSGMYVKPEEKLSKEIKSELIQAYLEQIVKTTSDCLDDAYIQKYIGTYNGNIVVSMVWTAGCMYPNFPAETDKEIGGVTFSYYSWMAFEVYHFDAQ